MFLISPVDENPPWVSILKAGYLSKSMTSLACLSKQGTEKTTWTCFRDMILTCLVIWGVTLLAEKEKSVQFSQFSHSVMSDSLRPHELQHARPPCSSPTPGVNSDSRSSSQWCHPAISFSVIPFSSCPQSLPASESFPMSQLFAWGGQQSPHM